MPEFTDQLTEQLSSMIKDVPDTVDILELTAPDVGTVQRRTTDLLRRSAELAGFDVGDAKVENQKTRTLITLANGARAVGFHASGAMVANLGLEPFDKIFDKDPGDDDLTRFAERAADALSVAGLVPQDDKLAFEHLWRIKAAGGDRTGITTDPVLCRAVGAYRHFTRDLPVYGRASAALELAAGGQLAGLSVSARRFSGDESGKVLDRAKIRDTPAAASEIALQLSKTLGGPDTLEGVKIVPEWFRFGYLSLGRRKPQGLLAPFFIASIRLHHEFETTAHLLTSAATEQRYLRLPTGQRAASKSRTAQLTDASR